VNQLNIMTAEAIKYHFVRKIVEICKERNIPVNSMAFHTDKKTLEEYYNMLDADNIEITLKELVDLAHAADLSIHIELK